MSKEKRQSGRPQNASELWDQVFDNLSGAFWNDKGLAATCPFCMAESSPSKMKFLIRFEDEHFKGYSCFICNQSGSGSRGISKLSRQIGLQFNTFDAGSLAGQDEEVYSSKEKEKEEIVPQDWPPLWAQQTEEVRKKGIEYMAGRGILDVEKVVNKFSLIFSEVVEQTTKDGDKYLRTYPCMVAPMAGDGEEVLGWTTRRLGNSSNENEPKSIAMSGRGWKTQSLFGLRELDPRRPVSIVEGVFSALSTPNSVAIGGKSIASEQLSLLAETGARVFVFALDPEVKKTAYASAMYDLHLEAPGSSILSIDWEQFGDMRRDPNDRGWVEMTKIITKTVKDHLK